jgi:ribosome-associated toxin RatA of RatAB toxin-antitoxin module
MFELADRLGVSSALKNQIVIHKILPRLVKKLTDDHQANADVTTPYEDNKWCCCTHHTMDTTTTPFDFSSPFQERMRTMMGILEWSVNNNALCLVANCLHRIIAPFYSTADFKNVVMIPASLVPLIDSYAAAVHQLPHECVVAIWKASKLESTPQNTTTHEIIECTYDDWTLLTFAGRACVASSSNDTVFEPFFVRANLLAHSNAHNAFIHYKACRNYGLVSDAQRFEEFLSLYEANPSIFHRLKNQICNDEVSPDNKALVDLVWSCPVNQRQYHLTLHEIQYLLAKHPHSAWTIPNATLMCLIECDYSWDPETGSHLPIIPGLLLNC